MMEKFAVIVFPGSNCDHDAYHVINSMPNSLVKFIWHKERDLKDYDAIIIPGGFSYGDYLRAGAIAQFSPIMNSVIEESKKGKKIIGICNGFQILIETGLLPGVLLRNKNLKFISKNVFLKVINTDNQFCFNYKKKNIIELHIAHNEGNYFADINTLQELEDNNLIALKYCDEKGNINIDSNPNGSSNNIAGLLNKEKNILGIMPHPERLIDPLLSGIDGSIMFDSLLKSK